MMMKKKRFLILGISAALLCGCGSNGDGNAKGTKDEEGKTTITVAGYPSADQAFEAALASLRLL